MMVIMLLVVDISWKIYFVFTHVSWYNPGGFFMVNKKRDNRVLGSFVVILTSCSIHERVVALSRCHSTV
jgi:hypothetical protein